MNKTLITHLYYGDPRETFSLKLGETLLENGADILEIGIPYTDPVCDGEVFQRACQRALMHGTTPLTVLEGIKQLTLRRLRSSGQAIYLTSYYAPIFKMGIENFIEKAKNAGVTGLIIPDILLEEQDELRKVSKRYGLSVIQFATVYSSKERLKQIIEASTGFIYCVSLPGVTGDSGNQYKLLKLLKTLKSLTNKKIYVGFGIQSEEDVKNILGMDADGVIVGSAIARIYGKYLDHPEKSLFEMGSFVKKLKESTI